MVALDRVVQRRAADQLVREPERGVRRRGARRERERGLAVGMAMVAMVIRSGWESHRAAKGGVWFFVLK